MDVKNKKIGFVLTGSFYTLEIIIPTIKELINLKADIIPIMSNNTYDLVEKIYKNKDIIDQIEQITSKKIIHTIQESERVGPKMNTDIVIVLPCTRKYYF